MMREYLLRYMQSSFQKTAYQVYSSPRRLLAPAPHTLLLDCGCGDGSYSQSVGHLLGTSQVYGVELNAGQARAAQDNGVRILRADVNQAIPLRSNSIDTLITFNVLEHLVETQCFLRELYRVLRPGGLLLLNTPNLASWHNIAALVLGVQPFSGPNITSMTESDVPIVRRMHRRVYGLPEEQAELDTAEPERHRHIVVVAYRSLRRAMQQAGFQIDYARGYGYYPFPPFLAWLLSGIDPSHAHHLVIKARKPAA
jgi:SAM-dependent methyltransferase